MLFEQHGSWIQGPDGPGSACAKCKLRPLAQSETGRRAARNFYCDRNGMSFKKPKGRPPHPFRYLQVRPKQHSRMDAATRRRFSVLCVPEQQTERCGKRRAATFQNPQSATAQSKTAPAAGKLRCAGATYERTYRRTNVLDCGSNVA